MFPAGRMNSSLITSAWTKGTIEMMVDYTITLNPNLDDTLTLNLEQGTIAMIVDAFSLDLAGADFSDVDNRYVDGFIQLGGPTGQILEIRGWDVSSFVHHSPDACLHM